MTYDTPAQFNFDASNSTPEEFILSAVYNTNMNNIELALGKTRALALDIRDFVEVLEIGNYIRYFDSSEAGGGKVTLGSNTITIAADAVIAWNNTTKNEVVGWPSKVFNLVSNSVEMANNFEGTLWIIWDGGVTKDYQITARLAAPPANGYRVTNYQINGSGLVTFSDYQVSRFWESEPVNLIQPIRLDGGITGTTKYPPFFYETSGATWASNSTISIAYGLFKDDTNTIDIDIASSRTLDISTTGPLGVCQSANLAGTMTVVSGTNTVAGTSTTFLTNFVVGDPFRTQGGQCRRITAIISNTSLTVESNWTSSESGLTYRRGGEAPNTEYYIYAALSSNAVTYVLSTRNKSGGQTLVDLPSGFTKVRQLREKWFNNAASDLEPQKSYFVQPLTGRILIQEQRISSPVASVDFTQGINSNFTAYEIDYFDVVPSLNDPIFMLRTSSNGGSSFDSAANTYRFSAFTSAQGSTSGVIGGQATQIELWGAVTTGWGQSNSATYGLVGSVRVVNPSNASKVKNFMYRNGFNSGDGRALSSIGYGYRDAVSAINAVRFTYNIGNIASGTFRLYGVY